MKVIFSNTVIINARILFPAFPNQAVEERGSSTFC
jgi:hypothetical protein